MADLLGDAFKALPWYLKATLLATAAYGVNEVVGKATEKSLKGEVVVITGAGSGIGRLMALGLAGEGAQLALWDVRPEGIAKVAQEIAKLGGPARTYVCDVSDRHAVYAAAEAVLADFGRVDILINNAGIVSGKKLLETPDEHAIKTMNVNTIAHFWTVKAFLPGMLNRNHGHVVTIASAAGLMGTAGLCDYSASKYGAVGFDEALRLELQNMGKSGVITTCVCPFYINTGMFDGAKGRFDLLTPVLEQEYVASRVITAVKRNQRWLCLPRLVYTVPLLRGLLPTPVFDGVAKALGITNSMDHFAGRSKL